MSTANVTGLDDKASSTPRDESLMRSATGTAPAYTMTARTLHWITAALVLLMLPLGVVIANEWGGPLQDFLYDLHKSIGATLIPLILLRLLYRLGHPPLPLPTEIPAIQRSAAAATHWALYGLVLLQPLVGWIATSAYPAPIPVFGLGNLPPIWPKDRALSEQLFLLHGWLAAAIAGMVIAHVGASLFHHFVRKDRVLMRMVTG